MGKVDGIRRWIRLSAHNLRRFFVKARATVIIPTYGNARFARWAIKSVQRQTVKDIEICIICDGSPEEMISFFEGIGKDDPRIKVFSFPKSPRTGEPYRDIAIKRTSGRIICYCCHDDLWLPYHIEEMEKALKDNCFAHSIHTIVKIPKDMKDENDFIAGVNPLSLKGKAVIDKILAGANFGGLTVGAHTRKSYNELKEGWITTPGRDMPTDQSMWRKFLSAYRNNCATVMKITSLNFRKNDRNGWLERERDNELKRYYEKMKDPAFLGKIDKFIT